MSSVIGCHESTALRNQMAGSRPLLIGGLSFAVVLLAQLIYALTHTAAYTADPPDLKVTTATGSLSARQPTD
jgi:hypothetical protein